MINNSKGVVSPVRKYKIVLLGDQAVGKSSIINRFIYDIFDGDHRPTIGIDFIAQNIFLSQKTIRFQLWDTAGQQRFRTLIPSYIRDASVAVIVYDVSNRSTFDSVQKWIDDVRAYHRYQIIITLLANKVDVPNKEVTSEQGRKLAHQNQVLFKEVSAKSGLNIHELFEEIAGLLPETTLQQKQEPKHHEGSNSKLNAKVVLKQKDFTTDHYEGSCRPGQGECC